MHRRKFIGLTGMLSTIWLPMAAKAALNSHNPVVAIPKLDSQRSDLDASVDERPIVKVVGVGGMGTNGINQLIQKERSGIDYICVDSDLKTLRSSRAHTRIQLDAGVKLPDRAGMVYSMSEKSHRDIADALNGAHMVVIVAGMGGATGTGVAPEIATLARSLGALTLAVVTTPFSFEAKMRNRIAEEGLAELDRYADSVIVVPNEIPLRNLDGGVTKDGGLRCVNNMMISAVDDLTNSLCNPGLASLDLDDVRNVMSGVGRGTIGYGLASGHDRAFTAATKAVELARLLSRRKNGQDRIMVNIVASPRLKFKEVHDVVHTVRRHASTDPFLVFSGTVDTDLREQLCVSLVSFNADRRSKPK